VARLLCCIHIADYLQGLLRPLGPATQDHHWTIGIPGQLHLFSLDAGAWLATRSQGIEAKGRAFPGRHGALGRAARLAPARLIARLLQQRPIALAVAQNHHGGARGEARSHQVHQSDVQGLGTMPLGAVPHAPGSRPGAPFRDHVEPQRRAAAAHDTAIHHQHECL
jgi:hypothetical protein